MLLEGRAELVEPGLADDKPTIRFDLDRIVHAPDVGVCAAVRLDGPLTGGVGYAVNRIGFQTGFALGG